MHRTLPLLRLWWKHFSPHAFEVVGFAAAFSLTEKQRTSILTNETVVLMCVNLLHFLHLFLWCNFAFSTPFSFPRRLRRSDNLDRLNSQKSAAVLATAEALFLVISERIQVVIKRQFGACRDVCSSKYSNSRFSLHPPLPCLTIGIAAVVDEPSLVGFLTCVDDQALVQCQHVEVVGVVLVCPLYSLLAHLHVENLSYVLDHKIASREVLVGFQTPPPTSCIKGHGLGVLTLLHALVLAQSADWAVSWVALDVDGSVDAGGVIVTGVI